MALKGRTVNIETAQEDVMLDTFDMMASLNVARSTIAYQMKNGILPPPLDRFGRHGSCRWTVGYLRAWNRKRAEIAIERYQEKLSATISEDIRRTSEFG